MFIFIKGRYVVVLDLMLGIRADMCVGPQGYMFSVKHV